MNDDSTGEPAAADASVWTRRLCVAPALGLALSWGSAEKPAEATLAAVRTQRWPEIGPALAGLIPDALKLALDGARRCCKRRTSRWFSMLPTMDAPTKWLVEQLEQWRGLPDDPAELGRIADELQALHDHVDGELTTALERGLEAAFAEALALPDAGEESVLRLSELDTAAQEELAGWITQRLGPEARLLRPETLSLLGRAWRAAAGRLVSVYHALKDTDPRTDGQWYEQSESILSLLAFRLEELDHKARSAPPTRGQLTSLQQRVAWVHGLIALLQGSDDLGRDQQHRFESLWMRLSDLEDRLRVLHEVAAEKARPSPMTERRTREVMVQQAAQGRPWWKRAAVQLYRAGYAYNERGAFSMAASLSLSSLFVVLAGMGWLVVAVRGIGGTQGFVELLFRTLFPNSMFALIENTRGLVGQLESHAALYTVLAVLFLYFTFMLMLSLTTNVNYLFGINNSYYILDLSFLFGIFWKGFLLRIASIGVLVGVSLGGLMWATEINPGLFGSAFVRGAFSVLVLGLVTLILLPLDDVPLREKAYASFGFALTLPAFNLLFDWMAGSFQSYRLMLRGAPVALMTLWLYFGWVALLYVLALVFSLRDRRHVKQDLPRIAVTLEVLRLARIEPTFDTLQAQIGAQRSQLHEITQDLVGRGILQRFSPGIKPTAYIGDFHYRVPTQLDPDKVRSALFPELESALAPQVPVELRRRVGEACDQIGGELSQLLDARRASTVTSVRRYE